MTRPFQLRTMKMRDIVADQRFQSRVEGESSEWVSRLAEIDAELSKEFRTGITHRFPLAVFATPSGNFLVDGFHSFNARNVNKGVEVSVRIFAGTEREALLYSLTEANRDNALPLTDDDVRDRIRKILEDGAWRCWSDYRIAELCGTTRMKVRYQRQQMEQSDSGSSRSSPDDLDDESRRKWDSILDAGGKPTIVERHGKRYVQDNTSRSKSAQANGERANGKPHKSKGDGEEEDGASGEFTQTLDEARRDLEEAKDPPPKEMFFTDSYGVRVPRSLYPDFVGQDSLAGRMNSEAKSLNSVPFEDWLLANPFLAGQYLTVQTVDRSNRPQTVSWSVRDVAQWLSAAILSSKPSGVCRACDGEKCPLCKQTGYLPDWLYRTTANETGSDDDGTAPAVGSPGGDDSARGGTGLA